MKTVEDFIKVYDNIFDEDYCQELIDYFNNGEPIFRNSDNKPRFYEFGLQPEMMELMIWRVAPFLDKYVKSVGCEEWLPEKFCWEFGRVKKYNKNTEDQFAPHVDVGDRQSSKRFLAFLIYLNDVEEGGETNFVGINKKLKPKRGRGMIFPPLWMVPHQGKPTISCLLYTSPSPRDKRQSRMPSSA